MICYFYRFSAISPANPNTQREKGTGASGYPPVVLWVPAHHLGHCMFFFFVFFFRSFQGTQQNALGTVPKKTNKRKFLFPTTPLRVSRFDLAPPSLYRSPKSMPGQMSECQMKCQKQWHLGRQNMAEYMSNRMPDRMSKYIRDGTSYRMPEKLSNKIVECQNICRIECQNKYQIECQNICQNVK